MSLALTAKRIIQQKGATYTLQRRTLGAGANAWTAGTPAAAFVTCKARERGYSPRQIQGGIQQGDVELTIDAATLTSTPARGDRIALGTFASEAGANWLEIHNVEAPTEAGVAVLYRCHARR